MERSKVDRNVNIMFFAGFGLEEKALDRLILMGTQSGCIQLPPTRIFFDHSEIPYLYEDGGKC